MQMNSFGRSIPRRIYLGQPRCRKEAEEDSLDSEFGAQDVPVTVHRSPWEGGSRCPRGIGDACSSRSRIWCLKKNTGSATFQVRSHGAAQRAVTWHSLIWVERFSAGHWKTSGELSKKPQVIMITASAVGPSPNRSSGSFRSFKMLCWNSMAGTLLDPRRNVALALR